MKNSILILLITSFLVSCTSNTIFKKPENLIPKDTMVLLLTDLYLANSSRLYKNKAKERNTDYTYLVFDKYDIDSARFKESNFYYTTNIDLYESIYKAAEAEISSLNEKYKLVKKLKDSTRRDSLREVRRFKDSIRKEEKLKLKNAEAILSDIDTLQKAGTATKKK